MIDPSDARSRRARELLISGIFLTISCLIILLVIFWITDEEEVQKVDTPIETPVATSFEPREIVRILGPDASDCQVYETRAGFDIGTGLRTEGQTSVEKPAFFRLPSGTRVKVIRQMPGGPVLIEVTQGTLEHKQGYVQREYLMR
jgi:hypothetical protein